MTADPQKSGPLACIAANQVHELAEALRQESYRIFVLAGIDSTRSFFDAVRRTIPLDPPLHGANLVWDALVDSVSGGLWDVLEKSIAIIWLDADLLLRVDAEGFRNAVTSLYWVATMGIPRPVRVVLGGDMSLLVPAVDEALRNE